MRLQLLLPKVEPKEISEPIECGYADCGSKREQVFGGVKTKAVGGDLTSVRCAGKWLHLGISVDAIAGFALTIDEIAAEDAKTLLEWMEPIATSVGAEILVTDDADALKTVADELVLEQQVCKSHVGRNTQDLVEEL